MPRANPAAVAGGVLGALGAWLYLRQPGRTVETAVQELAGAMTGTINLTAEQQANVAVIVQAFEARGLGWLAVAAVANAYAESALDAAAVGDSGASVGLFQLHERYAGAGLSVEQRSNPATNANRIIDEAVVAGAANWRGRTNAELASLFGQYVERCAACGVGGSEYTRRAGLVAKLYGASVAADVP